jgi:hypothetical protein
MNNMELAKLKIERAIAIGSDYDFLDESTFKQMLQCLYNGLAVLPKESQEKDRIYNIVTTLLSMEIKKFGYVFKANSWKNYILINKNDVTELIWRAHSLLF